MQREYNFYIVPTPIGNLDDITLRAIEVLKSADLIACEDSRVTQNLLNHYNIKTKLISYHKYNEKSRVDEIINHIENEKTIALVSDAGTPMICDPGNTLITELRKRNIPITSLAGACAIPTFLSQVPRDDEFFTFAGFFPKTNGKAEELIIKYRSMNLVFYESPNRIINTLQLILKLRGDIKVAMSRELTKLYEETIIDNVSNIIKHYSDGVKGEIVCMIYADKEQNIDITSKIRALKEKGYRDKDISIILSTLYDINKNDIYKMALDN